MKKIPINLVLLFCLIFSTKAQNTFRVRVMDADTKKDIPGVNVFVNEIPGTDKISDDDGIVVYNNLPADRHCTINFRKQGYKYQFLEIQVATGSQAPNFKQVYLEKDYNDNRVVIYGRVEDADNRDVANTEIIVSFQGQSVSTKTDAYGNYRFEVEKGRFRSVRSFTLEVKIPDCNDCKETEDYDDNTLINKNMKIRIHPGGSGPLNPTGPSGNRITPDANTVSGRWEGKMNMIGLPSGFEMVLIATVRDNRITGTAQINYEADLRVFAKFAISGSFTSGHITISDTSVMDWHGNSFFCLKQYLGELIQSEQGLVFSGNWNNDNGLFYNNGSLVTNPNRCPGGFFILKKL